MMICFFDWRNKWTSVNLKPSEYHAISSAYGSAPDNESTDSKCGPAPQKQVKLINMNARSIVNKTNQLEALLLTCNPHVVVRTETRLCSKIRDQDLVPRAYKMYHRDSASWDGGVAVRVKTGINVTHLPVVVNTESVCLRISLLNECIVLYAVYRPQKSLLNYLFIWKPISKPILITTACHRRLQSA